VPQPKYDYLQHNLESSLLDVCIAIQFLNAVSTPRDDIKHSGSKKSLLVRRTQYIGYIYVPLVNSNINICFLFCSTLKNNIAMTKDSISTMYTLLDGGR